MVNGFFIHKLTKVLSATSKRTSELDLVIRSFARHDFFYLSKCFCISLLFVVNMSFHYVGTSAILKTFRTINGIRWARSFDVDVQKNRTKWYNENALMHFIRLRFFMKEMKKINICLRTRNAFEVLICLLWLMCIFLFIMNSIALVFLVFFV